MTPDDLRALHPELFEIAEQLRARDPGGGSVRIRCIRTRDGVVAGKLPEQDPGTFTVDGSIHERLIEHFTAFGSSSRGRRR